MKLKTTLTIGATVGITAIALLAAAPAQAADLTSTNVSTQGWTGAGT